MGVVDRFTVGEDYIGASEIIRHWLPRGFPSG
jgi:hypothetical protein